MMQFLVEPIVRAALQEDLGRRGDVTTQALALYLGQRSLEARIVAREAGTLSGLLCAQLAFALLDGDVHLALQQEEGAQLKAGTVIALCSGPAASILSGERVALNFLGHLSGIATRTKAFVDAVSGTKAKIAATRKTTPGLRVLEKEAVRVAGGLTHRFGLDDAILVKDNHIKMAGSLASAIRAAMNYAGHTLKVQVEVDDLDQLQEAIDLGVDAVLLDNMSPSMLQEAVAMTAGHALLEASGGVTLETVAAVARAGVDLISCGGLTHSAPSLDVALDID